MPRVKEILHRYKSKLNLNSTKILGIQAKLTLKENTTPVFCKPRTVPFKLLSLVEQELQTLVRDGVLEKVNTSQWVTPIVPVLKKNNRVRICGDFSIIINPNLLVDQHPLPTIDELFASMAGGVKFTKIDLQQAYLQLEVREEDRALLTLNTHKGLFRSTRLMYGIASAPAIWQREMENILRDIPGVSVFIDDIRITGPDDETHLRRLELVLQRLASANIRINEDKCEFFKDSIEYCGFKINKNGILKTNSKIEAINRMPRPRNIIELRAFLGMVNYYGRFINNLSSILTPLHYLLQKNVPFYWSQDCENAFQNAKCNFKSNIVLVHYDPKLPLILATDASPYGVGAVLSHRYPDGTERVIQYASQTLTVTQRKYAQIEAYAIIFGICKFHQYLYGNKFTLFTDHRPLVQIFSHSKTLPAYTALRMQHYAVFLQGYTFDIKYKKSSLNSNTDCLSRLPTTCEFATKYDVVDIYELGIIQEMPITADKLTRATNEDKQLREIINSLKKKKEVSAKLRFNINQAAFSIQQDVLLCNGKVVIPNSLRQHLLNKLHGSHFGVVKMKALARSLYWWPGLDRAIENMARNCSVCNTYRNDPPKVEVHEWKPTKAPFERVHVDYAGPFKDSYFFIFVDAFSKWPFVFSVKDMTTKTTILKCKEIFTDFGFPEMMVMDNGRNFRSSEFLRFLETCGVTPKFTAPYHPSTNGQAERLVQTVKNSLRKIFSEPKNRELTLSEALRAFLLQYRITPHCTTGIAPAERMFNRKMRSPFNINWTDKSNIVTNVNSNKNVRDFAIGDMVRCRNYRGLLKWKLGKVISRIGKLHYRVKLEDGRIWERHVDQLLRTGELEDKNSLEKSWASTLNDQPFFSEEHNEETVIDSQNRIEDDTNEPLPLARREDEQLYPEPEDCRPQTEESEQRRERPERERRLPGWLTDY